MAEQTPNIKPTMSATGSLAPEYFDRLYAQTADPWDFETSPYEAGKYTATLAALPRRRYAHALELGCSIGVLTRQLATRCERLLAADVSASAIAQARLRCADRPQVSFAQCEVSRQFPAGRFDLILVSEVGYYFSLPDLENLRARIAAALDPHGHLLLVHYTGETNYPLTADAVHDAFLTLEGRSWNRLRAHRAEGYRLDLLEKTDAESGGRGPSNIAATNPPPSARGT